MTPHITGPTFADAPGTIYHLGIGPIIAAQMLLFVADVSKLVPVMVTWKEQGSDVRKGGGVGV